ncbi:MAG: DUF885 domain-containing protein, partial [Alphaproteobacteria bacterium]|nr:DUF885 domain-containing protein [Alphaproteobacteria bacterium]
MIKNIFLSLFLSLMIGPYAWANNSDDFQKILTDHWARATKEKVFFRTDPDGFRMNGTLPELSKAARDRRAAFNDKILKRLSHITENELNRKDQISYKIFKFERQTEAESYRQPGHLFPITKLF